MSKGSPKIRVTAELLKRLDYELALIKRQLEEGRSLGRLVNDREEPTYSDVISKLLDHIADHRQRGRSARRGACLASEFLHVHEINPGGGVGTPLDAATPGQLLLAAAAG